MHLVSAEPGRAIAGLDIATTTLDALGRFIFPAVPPGQYAITLYRPPGNTITDSASAVDVSTGAETVTMSSRAVSAENPASTPTLWANAPLTVGNEPVTGVQLLVQTGVRVSGRIEFDGTTPHPAQYSASSLQMRIPEGGTDPFLPGRIDADGHFATPQIPSGRYWLFFNPPAPWVMRSAMFEGHDISDAPIDINREITDVVITLTDRPSTVTGIVRDGAGKPVPTATALVFPTERRHWTDVATSRRAKSVPVTPAGAFSVSGLPAGDYFVIGLANELSNQLEQPRSSSCTLDSRRAHHGRRGGERR